MKLLEKGLGEYKREKALELLKEHKISVGKAAEECELSLWEMLDVLKQKNVDWTAYSQKDLDKDLALLE